MGSLEDDLGATLGPLEETHASWVFLTADEAFKVKKPVNFGFLDYSSLDKRRRMCELEVQLNRRLAPDVYRDVTPVTRDSAGVHALDGDGQIVDWAVRMRRLALEHRADSMLENERLRGRLLDRLAHHLADFHSRAATGAGIDRHGEGPSILANINENFEQTADLLHHYLSSREAAEIESKQKHFLEDHSDLLTERVSKGRIRDGHGDLRLEHVYFEPPSEVEGEGEEQITVVDAVEFSPRYRCSDVCADIAFLAMELAWYDRSDLAERFLAEYALHSDDYDLYRLVDFYESYRAFVRGKIAAILACAPSISVSERARAQASARRHFRLSLAADRRPVITPTLILIGGGIATGKSTLARALAHEIASPHLQSDRTRKNMLGVELFERLETPAFAGVYSAEWSERVYVELFRRAECVLESGRSVVLDASFSRARWLGTAHELADRIGCPVLPITCVAAYDVRRQRLADRFSAQSISDGRLALLEQLDAARDEIPTGSTLELDTSLPIPEIIALVRERLPTWKLARE